jgi:hypothetical protein
MSVELPPPPAAASRPRARVAIALVVIVVLAGVAGVAALVSRRSSANGRPTAGRPALGETFRATPEHPYSIRYPSEWHAYAGQTSVLLAPVDVSDQAAEHRVLDRSPGGFTGLYLDEVTDEADFEAILRAPDVQVESRSTVEVDGRRTSRIHLLTTPFTDVPSQVHLVLYLVDVGGGKVAPFGFFASAATLDVGLFDDIMATARFDPGGLARLTGPGPSVGTSSPSSSPSL